MPRFPSQSVSHVVVPVIGTIIVIKLTADQVNCTVTIMSIPPTTPFTEAVSIGAFPCMRSSATGSLITCYLPLVSAPPHAILLDMAFLATCPTDGCFLLVWWCLAFALVRAILGSGRGSGGCRCAGWW